MSLEKRANYHLVDRENRKQSKHKEMAITLSFQMVYGGSFINMIFMRVSSKDPQH